MKIKIDAGYRSVDVSGQGDLQKYTALPYVKVDIDINIEWVKYFDNRTGEANSDFHKSLESALKFAFSEIAKGVQVY